MQASSDTLASLLRHMLEPNAANWVGGQRENADTGG